MRRRICPANVKVKILSVISVKQALEYTWNEEVKTPNATVMGFYSDKGINMENTEHRLFN